MPTDNPAQALARRSWELTPDRRARTAPARAAMDQRFLDQANGDPELAVRLRRAYYSHLSVLSVAARRRAAAAKAVDE